MSNTNNCIMVHRCDPSHLQSKEKASITRGRGPFHLDRRWDGCSYPRNWNEAPSRVAIHVRCSCPHPPTISFHAFSHPRRSDSFAPSGACCELRSSLPHHPCNARLACTPSSGSCYDASCSSRLRRSKPRTTPRSSPTSPSRGDVGPVVN